MLEIYKNAFLNDFFDNTFVPLNDIVENEDSYGITLLLAGVKKEDIDIKVEDNNLIVSGERKFPEDTKYNVKEIVSGKFKKKYSLPKDVDVDNIVADYDNGLLNLTVPKKEKEGIKSIQIH